MLLWQVCSDKMNANSGFMCVYIYIYIFSKYFNLQVNIIWIGSIELKLLTLSLSMSKYLQDLIFRRGIALYTNWILRRSLGFAPEAKKAETCHSFFIYKWELFQSYLRFGDKRSNEALYLPDILIILLTYVMSLLENFNVKAKVLLQDLWYYMNFESCNPVKNFHP